ncbi:MAG: hypothetical protein WC908_00820 [Candidatus Paceibacterota bacterium]
MEAIKIIILMIFLFLFLFIFFLILVFNWIKVTNFLFPSLKRWREKKWNKEIQEIKDYQKKSDEEHKFIQLRTSCKDTFGFELETVNESGNQNEVIRIVNLLAYETSEACVKQNMENRGKKVKKYVHPKDQNNLFPDFISWDTVVQRRKISWAETRELALKIVPELKDQMPHFSEFDPLKSYSAKHLLKKKM